MANSNYAAGEALILTAIQAISSFATDGNKIKASRGDWKLLNKGNSRDYCILRQGSFERAQQGLGGKYESNWITIAEVWVRYIDDSTTHTRLQSKAQDVIDKFDAERKAGDTTGRIGDVFVRSGGEPEEMWRRGGNGPAWLRQELVIEWSEESETTLTD
jgi:hypothetical protein